MNLSDVVDKFPNELKEPIIALIEMLRKEDIRSMREEMKAEFKELRGVVKDLAQFQRKSEERLIRLEETVEKLIQAQRKSEERLTRLEEMVEKLIQAQRKFEERLTRLEETVEKLIQAQRKTEERLEELAQAQKRTEETLNRLIKDHAKTREKVENLSHNFGFLLEDRAIQSLPEILKEKGLGVRGRLRTKRMVYNGKEYEINIYGVAEKEGKRLILVGECKSRMSKKEVNRFLKVIERIKEELMEEERAHDIYPIVVVHRLNMEMERYLKEKGIDFVESYLLRI